MMKYFKHPGKYRMVITPKSQRFYFLQKLHILLCVSVDTTIWDITSPIWFLTHCS